MPVTRYFLLLFFCGPGLSLHLILLPAECNATPYTPSSATGNQVEVDVVYMRLFPWHRAYKHKKIKDCSSVYIHKKNRRVLECLEHIHLLRPEKTVQQWQYEQLHNGSVKLHSAAFRVGQVRVEAVRTITSKNIKSTLPDTIAGKVTGVFISHRVDVRQYKFKNIATGNISTVNATRNHQFYVRNKKAFIPIAKISSGDRLVTADGETIRLICAGERQTHCGLAYNEAGITLVYDLEIDKKHTYLVGEQHILVHNTCMRAVRNFFRRCRRNHNRLTLSDADTESETSVDSRESRWKRFKSFFRKSNRSPALNEAAYEDQSLSELTDVSLPGLGSSAESLSLSRPGSPVNFTPFSRAGYLADSPPLPKPGTPHKPASSLHTGSSFDTAIPWLSRSASSSGIYCVDLATFEKGWRVLLSD